MFNHKIALFIYCFFLLGSSLGEAGCSSSESKNDLSNTSFSLLNQDSTAVNFPQDFKGNYVVVGFIYTHCPDVCPAITANLSNVNQQLEDNSDVHFVEITFDPKRDTPSVLNRYMKNFKLDERKFTMLTGNSATVDSLLGNMDILAQIASRDTTESGKAIYFMSHTNRILLMDKEGRIQHEYPGSVVPPKNIIADLNKLR